MNQFYDQPITMLIEVKYAQCGKICVHLCQLSMAGNKLHVGFSSRLQAGPILKILPQINLHGLKICLMFDAGILLIVASSIS